MEQILSKIFRYIPEWVFVLIIIGLGMSYFFYDKPLMSVCDAQISDFANGQNGKLFPRAVQVLNPLTGGVYFDNNLKRSKNHCIASPQGKGCYQYFKIIQSVLYDFKKLENQCLKQLLLTPIIQQLFEEYLTTMALLAWGEHPPRSQSVKTGFLSDPDIKTFCVVKSYFQDFYPPATLSKVIQKTLNQLVIDPKTALKLAAENKIKQKLLDAKAENLNSLQTQTENNDEIEPYKFEKAVMDYQRAYDLSLFSTDCLFYL